MRRFFSRRPEIVVTQHDPDDLPGMADIHAKSFPQAWSEDDIASMLAASGASAWVARIAGGGAGRPLGFVIARTAADEAEIITVASDPAHRRAGVGRALMEHAIRELQRERVTRLLLEVSERNLAAIALYRSLGFVRIGERKGYYASHAGPGGAQPPAALVMARDLR